MTENILRKSILQTNGFMFAKIGRVFDYFPSELTSLSRNSQRNPSASSTGSDD